MNKQNQHQPTLLEQAQLTQDERDASEGAPNTLRWVANAATRKAFEVVIAEIRGEYGDAWSRDVGRFGDWLHAQLQQGEAGK